MRKNISVLIILLVLVIGFVSYWFQRFSVWYEQTIGNFFTYVVILLFILFVLYPFKLIKDKKEKVSILSYLKFAAIGIFLAVKALCGYVKEIFLTILYVSNSYINNHTHSDAVKHDEKQHFEYCNENETEIVPMSETSEK